MRPLDGAKTQWEIIEQFVAKSELAVIALAADITVQSFSPSAQELMPISSGAAFRQWVHPHDWEDLATTLASSVHAAHLRMRVGVPEGWRYCHVFIQRWDVASTRWLVALSDATDRTQSLRRYQALMQSAAVHWAEWSYSPKTGIHVHSPKTFELIFDRSARKPRNVPHARFMSMIHSDDREPLEQGLSDTASGKRPLLAEFRVLRPDGGIRWVRSIGARLLDFNDHVSLTGIAIDVTEEHHRAEEAARAQRLEAVGLLAAGMAHDINNQLTIILGHLSLSEGLLDEPLEESARLAHAAVEKSRNLVRALMALGQDAPVQRVPVALQSVLTTCPGTWPNTIHWDVDVMDSLWPIDGDPVQLGQVFDNLIRNAVEAMEGRGTIRIAARESYGHGGVPQIDVLIEDDGPGVPHEIRSHLFDPYFTTKFGGHGLGLATAYAVIRRHGGTISLEDGKLGGAAFRIRLPARTERQPVGNEDTIRLTGTALIIDDDPGVLATASAILKSLGLNVHTACDGNAALAWLDENSCDVILLDWVMPEPLNGYAVWQIVKQKGLGIPVIVSSGYADLPIPAELPILPKPYTRREARRTLRSLMPFNSRL